MDFFLTLSFLLSSLFAEVESYNPADNEWVLRPSLNFKKGSLAGATLNNKMFAVGGGDGEECFSSVEMFDFDVGRWISTRSMLQKVSCFTSLGFLCSTRLRSCVIFRGNT